MSTEAALAILFGIMALLTSVAGLHYRDSLCSIMCRTLYRARYPGIRFDIVTMFSVADQRGDQGDLSIGLDGGLLEQAAGTDDEDVIELQPRRTLPLYYDPMTSARVLSDMDEDILFHIAED
ncbi:hypothetical protein EJ04DRAFT_431370 [Polyplosphaeria fusca]|uniref:Uncharacterized protein n=1 Tax=Polyplosphaeria fusca TaxID=682080 RepID=A0A9P4V430_9PLEO|nr:hypothetical protein EJ04DRAFT_431370 [Polyplosphaeria fusca]